jgi:hypothetical protein
MRYQTTTRTKIFLFYLIFLHVVNSAKEKTVKVFKEELKKETEIRDEKNFVRKQVEINQEKKKCFDSVMIMELNVEQQKVITEMYESFIEEETNNHSGSINENLGDEELLSTYSKKSDLEKKKSLQTYVKQFFFDKKQGQDFIKYIEEKIGQHLNPNINESPFKVKLLSKATLNYGNYEYTKDVSINSRVGEESLSPHIDETNESLKEYKGEPTFMFTFWMNLSNEDTLNHQPGFIENKNWFEKHQKYPFLKVADLAQLADKESLTVYQPKVEFGKGVIFMSGSTHKAKYPANKEIFEDMTVNFKGKGYPKYLHTSVQDPDATGKRVSVEFRFLVFECNTNN